MKVEFKRVISEYPGNYVGSLSPGIYLVDEDDLVVVSKSKEAINLRSLYQYTKNDFLGRVRPIGNGNQVIITGD